MMYGDKISQVKEKIVEYLEETVDHRGVERLNDIYVDMVKDLSEAEKNCCEAEYYKAMTETMANKVTQGGDAYMEHGYRSAMPKSMRRTQADASHVDMDELIEYVRSSVQSANPDEREDIRKELKGVLGFR